MKEPVQPADSSNKLCKDNNNCSDNYYALFEQATDAILVTDFKGNFKDVNAGFCSLFGYTKEELLRRNIKDLLDEDHLQQKPIRFDLLAEGQNIFNERKMVHKNGEIIFVEANSKRFGNNNILVIARNITERRKAEELLRKSEANLHAVFDNTDTIYVLMDNECRIMYCNQAAQQFANHQLSNFFEVGKYFADCFPLERKPEIIKKMNSVLKGSNISYEIHYPGTGAAVKWYHVRMFPIAKGNKNIYGLMTAVSDITEKKILQEQLMNQKIQEQKNITKAVAEAQEKERAEIGGELHDNVNQLLASSSLFLAHCLTQPDKTAYIFKSREYIAAAMQEIRKLSHALVGPARDKTEGLVESIHELINDILLVQDIVISFDHSCYCEKESGAELTLVIYRIIQEQMNNILKYAHASAIEIILRNEGDYLTVIINDNGDGFDMAEKKSGIGLKNIKYRAELFNGVVQITTAPGKGCKMKIIFQLNFS